MNRYLSTLRKRCVVAVSGFVIPLWIVGVVLSGFSEVDAHKNWVMPQQMTPAPDVKQASQIFAQAEALYLAGQYQAALPLYQEVARLSPSDAIAWQRLAQTLSYLMRYDDAILAITRSLDIEEENAEAWLVRGAIRSYLDGCEAAITDYEVVLELDPNSSEALGNLSSCYLKLELFEQALDLIDQAINLDEDDATYYYDRGNVYRAINDCDSALVDYQVAVELDPTYADAYNNMANCFQSLGQFALAITNIQIAIDIEPRAQFYANLSEYLRQAKQYEEAVDAAETAITIDSQFALAYRALGNVYFELGDYLNAAYNYQLVVLYDPGEMSAWYNLGVAYSEMGELDEAVMALEVVVTEGHDSPEYISSLNNLAYLYIDKLEAHYDRAIELAETALALIEDDTQRGYVLDTIAWGFFKSGDCAQANVLILEAVELVRDNPEIQDHLAIIESDCES